MSLHPISARRPSRAASGFSLIELMLALVAGLIVSGAALTFFLSAMKSNGEYVRSTRLTQELRNSLSLVSRDLRRAGYNDNYMSLLASDVPSLLSKMYLNGECIMYSYDRSGSGARSGVIDDALGEVRGVRRKLVTYKGSQVGVIEFAVSSSTVHPACGGATATYTSFPPACNATSGWCTLSDPSILNITALTFTDSRVNANSALSLREIGVAISGQIANSPEFTRTVSTTVRNRSDCYFTGTFNCAAAP